MEIRAAEISAILKEQIENFGTESEVAEVGQVLSVGDGIARIYGLDKVQAGEMVEFPGGIKGMTLNLEEDNVGVVIFGDDRAIKEGDVVRPDAALAQELEVVELHRTTRDGYAYHSLVPDDVADDVTSRRCEPLCVKEKDIAPFCARNNASTAAFRENRREPFLELNSVLEEELVEIAHAIEEQGIARRLRPQGQELLHHRRGALCVQQLRSVAANWAPLTCGRQVATFMQLLVQTCSGCCYFFLSDVGWLRGSR